MSGSAGSTGRFRRAGGNLKSLSLNAQQHTAENNVMQRCYRVPVQQSDSAAGLEESHLLQGTLTRTARLNAELEQRFSG